MNNDQNQTNPPTSKDFINTCPQPKDILTPFIDVKFPFKAFPTLIQNLAIEQLEGRNIPTSLTCFCALGIIAGVAGYYYKLQNAINNHNQYANLYLIGGGDSSTGKSVALEPLQRNLMKKHNDLVIAHIKRNKNKKNKNINFSDNYSINEKSPHFIFSTITVEALQMKMGEIQAPMFAISSEAGEQLDIMGGMYKKDTSELNFYNKAWSCEAFSSSRVTRDDIFITKACLSALWLTQPYKIQSAFVNNNAAKNSGFMARPIFFKAEIVEEKENLRIINDIYFNEWDNKLDDILKNRYAENYTTINATDEAKKVFYIFQKEIKSACKGDLQDFETLLAKSTEKACRVALNIAICNNVKEVDVQIAHNACQIIKYSNSIVLEYYTSGLYAKIEELKKKVDNYFDERNTNKIIISDFKRYKRIEENQLATLCNYYPLNYEFVENEKGRKGKFLSRLENI